MSAKPTVTADAIPSEWLELVRELVQRQGRALRGPVDRPTIEVRSLFNNSWGPLMLYSSAMAFETTADRDAILARILSR